MIRKQKNKCSAFDLYMEMMWLLIGLQLVVNLFRFMNSLILPWLKMHKVFFTTRESLSWGPELFIMIAGFVKVACNICGVAAAIHLWGAVQCRGDGVDRFDLSDTAHVAPKRI